MSRHRKADYPAMHAIAFSVSAETDTLIGGGDAYLYDDGVFVEGEAQHRVFAAGENHWCIIYHASRDFALIGLTDAKLYISDMQLYNAGNVSVPEALSRVFRTQRIYDCELLNIANNTEGVNSPTMFFSTARRITAGASVIPSAAVAELPFLEEKTGTGFIVSGGSAGAISLPNLTEFSGVNNTNGAGICYSCPNLAYADLPNLTEISNAILFRDTPLLGEVNLPKLERITNGSVICGGSVTELTLPALETISCFFMVPGIAYGFVHDSASLKRIYFPKLRRVLNEGVFLIGCNNVELIDAPTLESKEGGWNSPLVRISAGSAHNIHINLSSLKSNPSSAIFQCNVSVVTFSIHLGAVDGANINLTIGNSTYQTTALRSLTNDPGWRGSLNISNQYNISPESLQGFIANLGDNSAYASLTLNLGATNIAKLTEEQIAEATAKNYNVL